MIDRASRLALVLLLPFLLTSCFLAPGKFTSTLTVNADRTFTYSYVGEVYGFNPDDMMKDKDGGGDDKDADKPTASNSALKKIAFEDDAADKAKSKADTDAKFREIATALAKEQGFRKAEYVGDNKFLIDYQISGKLDHSFLFPYNLDAGIIIPFVAVELRANGTARVKAPGFANDSKDSSGLGAMGGGDATKASSKLDGVFTLDTDAEVVSQNNEDGATKAGGRTRIAWKATPLSSTPPMAVLRFK
jgi:hypothetical protein